MEAAVYGNPAYLIALHADRPPLADLIIALDNLLPGLRNIGGEGKQEVLRQPLLQSETSRRVLIVTAQVRDRIANWRFPAVFLYAADLTGCLRCDHGIRALA